MITTAIAVDREASAVGAARRAAAAMGRGAGLDEESTAKLALIVTELGTNLVKHAEDGALLLRALSPVEGAGVEVLSLDSGPGMQNVAECLRDGYSTGGTRGAGLGAVLRAASEFDVFSVFGAGTAVLARVRARSAGAPAVCAGAVCVAQRGETVCGDAWAIAVSERGLRALVVDGLGHGPLAAEASAAALQAFRDHADESGAAWVRRCHEALRSTRGAVLGLLLVERARRQVSYCGVGNVAATFVADDRRHGLTSQNGIVGHQLPEPRCVEEPWPSRALFVMNSDGLSTRWSVDAYPGLLAKHPSIVAGVLYRDFSRGRDDATVIVLRADGDERRVA